MLNKPFIKFTLNNVNNKSKSKLFTVVSTFAGGGGSSTGYKLAGGDVLLANDFIDEAVTTYRANYPNSPIINSDIRKITRMGGANQIRAFFRKYGVTYKELDILDGSPPCTTFSTATAGRGNAKIEKKNVKHSDKTQNRIGMLVHDYIYLVNCLQPKVCLFENVVPSKNSKVFIKAVERLRKHGYIVQWQTVSASDCGVAQNRRRLITIGVRGDIANKLGIKSKEDLNYLYPNVNKIKLSLKDVLGDLQIDKEERDILLRNCKLNASYEILKLIPKNPIKPLKIQDIDPSWKDRNSDFTLVRASWMVPSPTLTCRGQQLGVSGVHHPDEDRKFTVAELKRITGLPDDYKLTGSFNQKAERIGNMVPPLMTKTLAESVYTNILSKL